PEPKVSSSGTYLTIDPKLKDMMDRVDAKQPIASLAVDSQKSTSAGFPPLGLKTLGLGTVIEEAEVVGASVEIKNGIIMSLAGERPSDDMAGKRELAIVQYSGPEIALAFPTELGTPVEFGTGDPDRAATAQATPPPQTPAPRRGGKLGEARGGMQEDGGAGA